MTPWPRSSSRRPVEASRPSRAGDLADGRPARRSRPPVRIGAAFGDLYRPSGDAPRACRGRTRPARRRRKGPRQGDQGEYPGGAIRGRAFGGATGGRRRSGDSGHGRGGRPAAAPGICCPGSRPNWGSGRCSSVPARRSDRRPRPACPPWSAPARPTTWSGRRPRSSISWRGWSALRDRCGGADHAVDGEIRVHVETQWAAFAGSVVVGHVRWRPIGCDRRQPPTGPRRSGRCSGMCRGRRAVERRRAHRELERPWMTDHHADVVDRRLAALISTLPGRDVVDVGGGSGTRAVPLALLGCRVTVVDSSTDALASLSRRATEAGVAGQVAGDSGRRRPVGIGGGFADRPTWSCCTGRRGRRRPGRRSCRGRPGPQAGGPGVGIGARAAGGPDQAGVRGQVRPRP